MVGTQKSTIIRVQRSGNQNFKLDDYWWMPSIIFDILPPWVTIFISSYWVQTCQPWSEVTTFAYNDNGNARNYMCSLNHCKKFEGKRFRTLDER